MSNYRYRTNDLFKPDNPWQLNACIGMNGGPYDFDAYSRGYFSAAKTLVDAVIADNTEIDLTVYPIVYCYRHGIELALKHLAYLLPQIWGEASQQISTHKLIDAWGVVKTYLLRDQVFDEEGTQIGYVDSVINDIIQFDPTAEVFRFPSDRSGGFYLQDAAHINIPVLSETLEAVRGIFEGWSTSGAAMLDYKHEADDAMAQLIE